MAKVLSQLKILRLFPQSLSRRFLLRYRSYYLYSRSYGVLIHVISIMFVVFL
jgi:hypothetical protein